MFTWEHKVLLSLSVCFLVGLGIFMWVEHIVDEFWAIGLPLKVGGLVINHWSTFWVFVSGLSVLTIMRAILRHTVECDVDGERVSKENAYMTYEKVFWWVIWDIYEKLMDVFTILLAVMRFDIWALLFIVHIVTVFTLHACRITTGRRPRIVY